MMIAIHPVRGVEGSEDSVSRLPSKEPLSGSETLPSKGCRRLHDMPQAGASAELCASFSTTASSVDLSSLPSMSAEQLAQIWRRAFGRSAPARLPKGLLMRLLAYRLQAQEHGDLSRESARMLDRIADELEQGRDREEVIGPVLDNRLKPGLVLVREHNGEMHRVMVLAEGYAWKGGTYPSLSAVAKAITGTTWNGYAFFGLKEKKVRRERRGGEDRSARENASSPCDGDGRQTGDRDTEGARDRGAKGAYDRRKGTHASTRDRKGTGNQGKTLRDQHEHARDRCEDGSGDPKGLRTAVEPDKAINASRGAVRPETALRTSRTAKPEVAP